MTLTKDLIKRLPKAELHVHLDGCLRPTTLIELAREAGLTPPAEDPDGVAEAMLVSNAANLEEYLERFHYAVSLLQTPAALERVAYEFLLDKADENVRYVEVRYCPVLHTPAMSLERAFEAPLAGLARGANETGIRVSVIVTALRTMAPSVSSDLARMAADYREEGVVGFDLAGAEQGYPAQEHADAFRIAQRHGLGCTCHAGEGDGPDSIRQALHVCGAQRLGHATRLLEDPKLEDYVAEQRIPIEVCLSSNVHTRVVDSVSQHPVRRYFDKGCVVTINTDGPLMDGVSLTDEYWLAHTECDFSREEIDRLILNAFESAFLPDQEKVAMVARIGEELQDIT